MTMQKKYFVSLIACITPAVFVLLGFSSQAQMPAPANGGAAGAVNKKLNLEDITVRGELLGDDRMNFVRRQREELKNRIKFRTNFRPEILQEYKH